MLCRPHLHEVPNACYIFYISPKLFFDLHTHSFFCIIIWRKGFWSHSFSKCLKSVAQTICCFHKSAYGTCIYMYMCVCVVSVNDVWFIFYILYFNSAKILITSSSGQCNFWVWVLISTEADNFWLLQSYPLTHVRVIHFNPKFRN